MIDLTSEGKAIEVNRPYHWRREKIIYLGRDGAHPSNASPAFRFYEDGSRSGLLLTGGLGMPAAGTA
jgi:hypothetical protein